MVDHLCKFYGSVRVINGAREPVSVSITQFIIVKSDIGTSCYFVIWALPNASAAPQDTWPLLNLKSNKCTQCKAYFSNNGTKNFSNMIAREIEIVKSQV